MERMDTPEESLDWYDSISFGGEGRKESASTEASSRHEEAFRQQPDKILRC